MAVLPVKERRRSSWRRWSARSSRRARGVPSRHRRDSWPSHDAGGGFFFAEEAVRTEPRRAAQVRQVRRRVERRAVLGPSRDSDNGVGRTECRGIITAGHGAYRGVLCMVSPRRVDGVALDAIAETASTASLDARLLDDAIAARARIRRVSSHRPTSFPND